GYSPWPDYDRPNPEECAEVHRLLTEAHGESVRPDVLIVDNDVPGCGEVPCVLDALLRTVIALNTTTKNSGVAFKGLIDRFGIIEAEEDSSSNTKRRIYSEGAVGSVDWDGVRRASLKDVAESIQGAGLQVLKAKTMKGILDAALSKAAVGVDDDSDLSDIEEEDDDGELSLEHLRALDDKDVMKALTSYFGIGPKAAACVMLFALGRNLFPVDTHVYRLSKFLGWVPEDVKNENDAFYHLDLKIPNKYKYGLHNLLIRHGRSCKHCKAGPSSPLKEGDVTKQPAQPRLDENGQVIMKQRLVPRWEGNGLMKEVMVPMMVPDGVELDDSCIIEHLAKRQRVTKVEVKMESEDKVE
ncbi:DNA glycosylase, partial [Sphaerosporella brunnea]